ncbi:hypothetical protein KHQ82_04195 [Mycoplasmatota bacterium]|nr:hypothetical protein KHQ82_04195 [Mycoplasmatota bacterium]
MEKLTGIFIGNIWFVIGLIWFLKRIGGKSNSSAKPNIRNNIERVSRETNISSTSSVNKVLENPGIEQASLNSSEDLKNLYKAGIISKKELREQMSRRHEKNKY